MWLRIAIAAIAAACGFSPLPLQAQTGMPPAEQLLLPFSAKEWKSWKIGTQGKRPGFTMVEYVPKAQTVEDWDRMLTVQIFHNSSIPLPQFMGRMKTTFEAKQPCEQTKLQAAAARRSTVTRPVFTG